MEKRLNKILVIAIISVVYLMSIGYSVLNKNLNISGDLTYRPKGDIRITNVTQATLTNATLQYADFSKNEINFAYKSTTTSATIALTVEVTNFTSTEMGILKIENLPATATITGYTLKNKLTNANTPLTAGKSTTFTITIKPTAVETKTLILKFDFEPVYKVTYEGFSSTSGYKTDVLKGDTFAQNFGGSAPKKVEVTMNGTTITPTYANGIITISSVSGNINIKAIYAPIFIDSCETHPNAPVLNGDMMPVVYDEDKKSWVKQDLNKSYDYCNQIWANAVTVVSSKRATYKNAIVGTSISMDDINTMWVWVPRYSYTIKSESGTNYFGKASYGNSNPTRELPGEIDVKFISTNTNDTGAAKYTGSNANGWRTNEAFNFGGSAKAGIWVAKFEPTGTLSSACTNTSCNVSNITIKPGITSIRNQTISSFFYMARSMQVSYANTYGFNANSGDLHMIKNDEWGAIAYLSQSKFGKYGNSSYSGANKEVYINNNSSYITGTSGGGSSVSSSGAHYAYNEMKELGTGKGQAGPGASTTGTIYGIYDMNGGSYEYVMGVLEYDSQTETTHIGQIVTGSSGFKGLNSDGNSAGTINLPDKKYYNTYKSASPTNTLWTNAKSELACNGGVCYGHALSETYGATSGYFGWYQDYALFLDRPLPWFVRGGDSSYTTEAGLFLANSSTGDSHNSDSSRFVLV